MYFIYIVISIIYMAINICYLPEDISQIIWKYIFNDVIIQMNYVFSLLNDFIPISLTKYSPISYSYNKSPITYGKCGCQILSLVSNRVNNENIIKDFFNIYKSIFNSKRLIYFKDI